MLNRHCDVPLYVQLAQILRSNILSGKYKPGDKLPSESELVAAYAIGRLTVREALALLVNEELLEKRHGKGTFVRIPPTNHPLRIDVLLDLNDRYFVPFYLEGITEVLRKNGANCVLHNTGNREEEILAQLKELQNTATDGILLQPNPEDRAPCTALCAVFAAFAKNKVPVLLLDTAYEGLDTSYAIFDEKQAGHLAAQHFIENGHQYLAMIGNDARRDAFFRALGFEDYLIQHNYIPPIIENETDDPAEQIQRILRENPEVSGVFLYHDLLAVRAMEGLNERGLTVPDRVSIIGCDDLMLAAATTPKLTTIVHPKALLSREATQALLDIIHTPSLAPFHKVFSPTLVSRESCVKIR